MKRLNKLSRGHLKGLDAEEKIDAIINLQEAFDALYERLTQIDDIVGIMTDRSSRENDR